MATTSICTVDGCGKVIRAHGLCRGHLYRKSRYGDPTKGRASWGEPERFLREDVLPFDKPECLYWPYGRATSGYGVIRIGGQTKTVHSLVCLEVHGLPPAGKSEAAHLCGDGHLGCVNPSHLCWKSHDENMADMVAHGRSNRGQKQHMVKLTEADVRYLRSVNGAISHQHLAEKFGVSRRTISDAIRGRNWAWLE